MITNTRRLTQKQRVIRTLRRVGRSGIHSFNIINEISHKAPARISELRREGWDIRSVTEKLGEANGVRYTLHEGTPVTEKEVEEIFRDKSVPKKVEADQAVMFYTPRRFYD